MTPDITINRHGGNPESNAASESLDPVKPLLRIQVEALLACAGPRGLISEDVETALGLSHQTASARLTELKARGLAMPGERRITRSGRYARALVHADYRSEEMG